MSPELRYRAFLATLAALVAMFLAACVLAYVGRSVEAIGIGGVLTGLIALAGTFVGSRQLDTPNNGNTNGTVSQNEKGRVKE